MREFRMSRMILAACAAVLALAACGDDGGSGPGGPAGPRPIPAGRMSFSLPAYEGQAASTFAAQGAPGRDSLAYFTLGNWAFAEPGASARAPLYVYASAPAGAENLYHHVKVQMPRDVQAGAVVPLTGSCRSQATDCGAVDLLLNLVNPRPVGQGSRSAGCLAANANGGSVLITARTATRVAGTFTLNADCFTIPGSVQFAHSLVDGSFDVPIVQPGDYPPISS